MPDLMPVKSDRFHAFLNLGKEQTVRSLAITIYFRTLPNYRGELLCSFP